VFLRLTADQKLAFDWIAGACQVNLLKTGPGCLDGSQAALVSIAAAVIVLALFLFFVLLPS